MSMRILLMLLAVLTVVKVVDVLFAPPPGFWSVTFVLVVVLIAARGGYLIWRGSLNLRTFGSSLR